MRSASDNPFLPGSDAVPEVWAGRDGELAEARDVVAVRRLAGVHERGRAVLGEFGIGKSVLVNRVAREARAAGHWLVPSVRVPLGVDPLGLLLAALADLQDDDTVGGALGTASGRLAQRVEEVTLPVVGGGLRLRPDETDVPRHRLLRDALVDVATAARGTRDAEHPDGRLVVVRLDEVQNIRDPAALSQLLTALGDALEATTSEVDVAGIERRRALPLAVYLSGLPDLSRLAAAAGATFSRRFRVWDLEPLTEPELRTALLPFTTTGWPVRGDDGPRSVHLEPAGVDALLAVCLGDPFLFQLAGEAAWNAGRGPVITEEEVRRGWAGARREVSRYVASRLEGLSDLQLSYLQAAADLDPQERTAAAVAGALGRPGAAALGSTAAALDTARGLLRRQAGRVSFRSRRWRPTCGAPGPDVLGPLAEPEPPPGGQAASARSTAGWTTRPSATLREPDSRSEPGSRTSSPR